MKNLTDKHYFVNNILYVCPEGVNVNLIKNLQSRASLIFSFNPNLHFEKDLGNTSRLQFNSTEITTALSLLTVGSYTLVNQNNEEDLLKSFERKNCNVVIYHGNCPDGTMAAAIYSQFNPNEETVFVKGKHGTVDTDYENCSITFLDFCYPLEGMQELLKNQNKVLVIDHHKTAIEMLNKLGDQPNLEAWVDTLNTTSGAHLAWTYFSQKDLSVSRSVPLLVHYISQRDTWTGEWKEGQPHILNVLAYFDTIPVTIDEYQKTLEESCEDESEWFERTYNIGLSIRKYKSNIVEHIATSQLRIQRMFGQYEVAVLNCNSDFCSEVGNLVLNRNPQVDFALLYNFSSTGIKISLRSTDERIDVTTIAKLISETGGGHRNASGAFLPYLNGEIEDPILANKYIKLLADLNL